MCSDVICSSREPRTDVMLKPSSEPNRYKMTSQPTCLYWCLAFPGAQLRDMSGKIKLSKLCLWCKILSGNCVLEKSLVTQVGVVQGRGTEFFCSGLPIFERWKLRPRALSERPRPRSKMERVEQNLRAWSALFPPRPDSPSSSFLEQSSRLCCLWCAFIFMGPL